MIFMEEKNTSLNVHTGTIGEKANTEIGTSPQENVLFNSDLRKHWFNAQPRSKANVMKVLLLLNIMRGMLQKAENHIHC